MCRVMASITTCTSFYSQSQPLMSQTTRHIVLGEKCLVPHIKINRRSHLFWGWIACLFMISSCRVIRSWNHFRIHCAQLIDFPPNQYGGGLWRRRQTLKIQWHVKKAKSTFGLFWSCVAADSADVLLTADVVLLLCQISSFLRKAVFFSIMSLKLSADKMTHGYLSLWISLNYRMQLQRLLVSFFPLIPTKLD